jgi:hypothetical protein
MDKLFRILKLLQALLPVVIAVEQTVEGAMKGKDKKELVLGVAQEAYSLSPELQQAFTLPEFSGIAGKTVDRVVSTFNKTGIFQVSQRSAADQGL